MILVALAIITKIILGKNVLTVKPIKGYSSQAGATVPRAA